MKNKSGLKLIKPENILINKDVTKYERKMQKEIRKRVTEDRRNGKNVN